MESVYVLLLFGGSSKGVDFDQWLPLQCKLCMNFDDVHFNNIKIHFHVHVKVAFVFILTPQFNI